MISGSLPVRERGLKWSKDFGAKPANGVAPRAGAWIEISKFCDALRINNVAPRAGAWIEIPKQRARGYM